MRSRNVIAPVPAFSIVYVIRWSFTILNPARVCWLVERIIRRQWCSLIRNAFDLPHSSFMRSISKMMIRFSEYAKHPAEIGWVFCVEERRVSNKPQRFNHILPPISISSTDAFRLLVTPHCPGCTGSCGSPRRCGSECTGDGSGLPPISFSG